MGLIKRKATPGGPITEFFDRFEDLHLSAGQPSVREIASRLGQGVISHSTIYNALSGPRIPSWDMVDLIIKDLGGDTEEFRALWQGARRAEIQNADRGRGAYPAVVPDISSQEVPERNRFFMGRDGVIGELYTRMQDAAPDEVSGPRQALCGMPGVGKTEIAAEYVHRHGGDYDVIWWIQAGQADRVRSSLIELGRLMGLPAQ